MPSRPPSLFGGRRKAPVAVPRPRDAAGKPLPPLEARRESASKRGYGHRWQQCRKRILGAQPLCISCLKKGLYVPATLVDHIEPVQSCADPRFYALSNLQPLCRQCHSKKTWADTRKGLNRRAVPAAPVPTARAPRGVALARAARDAAPVSPALPVRIACA